MAGTGVAVHKDVMPAFNDFKLKKDAQFLVFKMNQNNTEIILEKKGERGTPYDEFLTHLPADDCRYAVCDIKYSTPDGERDKLILYLWAPEVAKTKSKMLYAGSKDTLKKTLQGVQVEVQGTDLSEVSFDEVVIKCKSINST